MPVPRGHFDAGNFLGMAFYNWNPGGDINAGDSDIELRGKRQRELVSWEAAVT